MPKDTAAGDPAGGGLVCHLCEEEMQASQLLLLEEHCWQGRLHCVCLKCSDLEENEFRVQSKQAWKKRSHNAKKLARVKGYQQGMLEIEREPDESVRAHRRHIFVASMTIASVVYAAFTRAPVKQQKQMLVAFDAFEAERVKVAENPAYQPSLMCCKNIFGDDVTQ